MSSLDVMAFGAFSGCLRPCVLYITVLWALSPVEVRLFSAADEE